MTDRRFDSMSDDDIAALIRRLPKREPFSELRARALCPAVSSVRKTGVLRPAMVLAALIVLFMTDFLVGHWQETQLANLFPAPKEVVSVKPETDQYYISGDDLMAEYRLVGLCPQNIARETYLELRDRLLLNGEGG